MRIDWSAPVEPLHLQPLSVEGLVERLRLTCVSAVQAVLGVPSFVLGVLVVVCLPTAPLGLGVLLALAVVPAARGMAALHRAVSGMLLGERITNSYRPVSGLPVWRRPSAWARDRARWRDFAGIWFSATGGLALSIAPVALLVFPITFILIGIFDDHSDLALGLLIAGPGVVVWWPVAPVLVKARALADRSVFGDRAARLAARVSEVEETRAESLDHSAAEIRRIERDLHDGAQARMAAVGMSVGLAEKLIRTDPDAAAALLREARLTTTSALEDLRSVVRGIMPPVLADRGLSEALEALAVSLPLPVVVRLPVPRLPRPIESAAYFAVVECLTNAVKHSGASRIDVDGFHSGTHLQVSVVDDGRGGAKASGHGLTGLARRLAAFDGTVTVHSPPAGPTEIRMEIPCPL